MGSNPAYLGILIITAGLGVLLIVSGVRQRTERDEDLSRRRIIARSAGIVGVLVLIAVVWWLRPLGATEPSLAAAEGAAEGSATVDVSISASTIELTPVGVEPTEGFIFFPGALVDPRAYVGILSGVAETGRLVVIPKPPLGIAFLAAGQADAAVEAHPEITDWAVGGHSLGGVVASSSAAGNDKIDTLVLWASFPNGSIADHTELSVTSISAGNDALATPADIAESVPDLPPGTTFVEVAGAIHAYFGDYGPQRGDGDPTISRSSAQEQFLAATLTALDDPPRDT